MARLSRRNLLAAAAGEIAVLQFPCPARADGPPVAAVRPVKETLWGVQVTDRYRWMEAEDAEWHAYVQAEGAYTASVLDQIPGRTALADRVANYTGAVAAVACVQTGGGRVFTELRPAGGNTSKLFVRETMDGADRKLIDPDGFAAAGSYDSLDWWVPSPDGSHVVFGISAGGSEQSVLHVLVTDTGQILPESMDRTIYASPSWLPDGTGFFYNRLQDLPPDNLAYEERSVCWLHRLNTNPAADVPVMGQGLSPLVAAADIDFPNVTATAGSSIVIGVLDSGVQIELTLYCAPLAGIAGGPVAWRKICGPEDGVTEYALLGDAIYLLTHLHAPHYRIVKATASAPGFAQAVEVVPQSEAVLRDIVAGREAVYIRELNAGLGGLRRLTPEAQISRIALPFQGAIEGNDLDPAFYADPRQDGVWFQLQGWVHPTVVCHAVTRVTQTDLAPVPDIDVSPYTSEELFATARDGTRVPLSLVYRKGLERNGRRPLLLWAYGAYGISQDPGFLARWLPLLDLGGVFAVAHVRGGGELGEDWHRAGEKLQKFHTWQDMIDCAEALIENRWTSHKRLGVIGGSAGGITVGRLMTERPELAAVVISEAGVSDALRSEFTPNGPANIPEFGSVKTREGFRGLLAMDAYQHVHDGVDYPSVMLTMGVNDPRVAPWEPTKMAARLQAASASGNPVLLRVEKDQGHGIGSTRAQRDSETADILSFFLWRTGDPGFQLKS